MSSAGAGDTQLEVRAPEPRPGALAALAAWKWYLAGAGVILLALVPVGVGPSVDAIAGDMHPKAWLGPALYLTEPGLIPGIDFFSQYGVGLPRIWALSFNGDPYAPLTAYFLTTALSILFFALTMYAYLCWLTRSALISLSCVLPITLAQFHWSDPLADASSYPSRYPLAAIVLAAATWTYSRRDASWPHRILPQALWAASLGTSVWFSTETGIYLIAASLAAGLLVAWPRVRQLAELAGVLAGALIMLAALSVLSFGTGALTAGYWRGLLAPLLSFSGGFGAIPIVMWPVTDPGLTLIATVFTPSLAAATIALVLLRSRLARPLETSPARTGAVLALAFLAFLFPLKYLNRSVIAVWFAGAVLAFALIAYWLARVLHSSLAARQRSEAAGKRVPALAVTGAGLCALALVYAWMLPAVMYDDRGPALMGLESYRYYPSIANRLLGTYQQPRSTTGEIDSVDRSDVALIDSFTKPGERVAVYGPFDWIYLAEAQRLPYFKLSPSNLVIDRQNQVANPCVPDTVFVQRPTQAALVAAAQTGAPGDFVASLHEECPDFPGDYAKIAQSSTLEVYQRKPTR